MGFVNFLPTPEKMDGEVNFYKKITGIGGKRKFPAGDFFHAGTEIRWFPGRVVQISIRTGRRRLSVRLVVRAGRSGGARGPCTGGAPCVVRGKPIPLQPGPPPLRG